jgi:hypothetical protein
MHHSLLPCLPTGRSRDLTVGFGAKPFFFSSTNTFYQPLHKDKTQTLEFIMPHRDLIRQKEEMESEIAKCVEITTLFTSLKTRELDATKRKHFTIVAQDQGLFSSFQDSSLTFSSLHFLFPLLMCFYLEIIAKLTQQEKQLKIEAAAVQRREFIFILLLPLPFLFSSLSLSSSSYSHFPSPSLFLLLLLSSS